MTRFTCDCTACNGKAILAPQGLIHGTPKQQREMTHTYVSYAHGTSPLSRIMCQRAGVEAA